MATVPMRIEHSVLSVSPATDFAGALFEYHGQNQQLRGRFGVDLSTTIGALTPRENDVLTSASLLVLAGLFVPDRIELGWNSYAMRQTSAERLLQMLCDIRACCAGWDFFKPELIYPPDPPSHRGDAGSKATDRPTVLPTGCDCLLLLSGGIDSTAALCRLIAEGARPVALHLTLNQDTGELEKTAAERVARAMGTPLLCCPGIGDGLPRRGASPDLWPQFGQFPYYNAIPHGRDIFSATVAAVLGLRGGITTICFGQERESREKIITYRGKEIPRHDVESDRGAAMLQDWLCEAYNAPVRLISPIAHLGIAEIREDMLRTRPELMALTQSCVWERLCGQCLKCISLYVLQRATGLEAFHFDTNPLADPTNEDLAQVVSEAAQGGQVGYAKQIADDLRRIIASGRYSPEDHWVQEALRQPFFRQP